MQKTSIGDTIDAEDIDQLDLYRLDYEDDAATEKGPSSIITGPLAAGGEPLREGDHVYFFCGLANVSLYQHHGIVLDVKKKKKIEDAAAAAAAAPVENENDNNDDDNILIAEFTNADLPGTPWFQSASHASVAVVTEGVRGGFRFVRETDPSKWHKVRYHASAVECWTWNPGTCSSATPDPVDVILQRVQFLREQYYMIPKYNILTSNCESVAVWCVTGIYTSPQGNRALDMTKLAVPAAGAMVIPVLGVALGGLAILWHSMSSANNRGGQDAANRLSREFAWYAMGRRPTITSRQWEIMDQHAHGKDQTAESS
jgi:Lecithin retinol acyltransferase